MARKNITIDEQGKAIINEPAGEKPMTEDDVNVAISQALNNMTETVRVRNNIFVGVTNIKIDGPNRRILINDGTNDRVLIGYLSGKF